MVLVLILHVFARRGILVDLVVNLIYRKQVVRTIALTEECVTMPLVSATPDLLVQIALILSV